MAAETISIITPYGDSEALHWYLTQEEIMWAALKELIYLYDFRGTISEWPDGQGNRVWLFEANGNKGESVTAVMGQHVVLVEGLSITAYNQPEYEYLINREI